MIALIVICIVTLIDNTNCQQPTYHRLTTKHGTFDSTSANSFTCPGNGAITRIKYYVVQFIESLEFTCSSSAGNTTFGPYGTTTGNSSEFICEEGQYISSFYGRAGAFLSNLGVRCRTSDLNSDLKGNGTDLGKMEFVSDKKEVPAFDDLAYSNGARPVGVKMWYSDFIQSIQFDFANIPVQLCTVNCTDYREENAPFHGGEHTANISVFSCANNGAITEIKTKVSTTSIESLQFGCSSGLGTTRSEVYGQPFGISTQGVTTVKCPPGTIVGSIHGYYKIILRAIGIRCVVNGKTGVSPKFNAEGAPEGTPFDDVKFSNMGWRPVQIRVHYSKNGAFGIQVKYGNAKVATNCQVTKIEVVDPSIQAKSDGIEVIGVTTGVTCWNNTQLLKLEYSRESAESVTVSTSEGKDKIYSGSVSISTSGGVKIFGFKAEASLTVTATVGGTTTLTTTKANTTTTAVVQSAGTGITYNGPGACAIIGYVERYKLDHNNVDVRYYYKCDTGETSSTLGQINLQATSYGDAYFDHYEYVYPNITACSNTTGRACVRALNANRILANSTAFAAAFYNCFK